MTIDEGATHEINSRWPVHKQRNCGLVRDWYGMAFYKGMCAGIELVREHHHQLKTAGETTWSIPQSLTDLLDDLADDESS